MPAMGLSDPTQAAVEASMDALADLAATAADCTASTAGGLISFDIDASLIYMPAC